jgi:hypothetical protein
VPISRVFIAAVFFIVGALVIVPLLAKGSGGPSTSTKPTVTITKTIAVPTAHPTATVTVTPVPEVRLVLPSNIAIVVNSQGGSGTPWGSLLAAGAAFIAGIGALAGGVYPWHDRRKNGDASDGPHAPEATP